MNANLMTISVGNTHTQIGAFLEGKLIQCMAVPSGDWQTVVDDAQRVYEQLSSDAPNSSVLLASVDPSCQRRLAEGLGPRLGIQVRVIDRDLRIPIGRQLDPEAIVGVDRLLNAAAAYDVLKQACVVVDAGTAITVDFIDGAGTFHGGAIGPGAQMMLDSLHQGTSQLPRLRMARPDEPIGHSTSQAMLSAVFYGLRGMVRELVEQYAAVVGAYPVVVATGGDARLLFDDDELVERVVDHLTLMGMAVAYEAHAHADP